MQYKVHADISFPIFIIKLNKLCILFQRENIYSLSKYNQFNEFVKINTVNNNLE